MLTAFQKLTDFCEFVLDTGCGSESLFCSYNFEGLSFRLFAGVLGFNGKIPASLNAETASSGLADLFHSGFNTEAKDLLLTNSPGWSSYHWRTDCL